MIFKGKSGTSYKIIEPAIGKGGEGSIYKINGMPNFVLKEFIDSKRTEGRERKLLTMIASPVSNKIMEHVTWPKDVVYKNGRFAGYVMPKINNNNKSLNVMYKTVKYNEKDEFIKKIIIAWNFCVAINSVHNAGQVCGDLNPNNITVNPNKGTVTLVDTDSYHITEKNRNRVYRCEVGMPDYLAPEIHEKMKKYKRLDTAPLPTFTRQTDLFALAVHIFALLMNGCHPFANAVDLSQNHASVAAPQPIENIRNGFFPFYMNKSGLTIPKYAPKFDQLPEKIRKLFIRAFVDGHKNPQVRPNAIEWYNALVWYGKSIGDNRLKVPEISNHNSNNHNSNNHNSNNHNSNNNNNNNNNNNSNNHNSSSSYITQPNLFASKMMFWFLTVIISLGVYIRYYYNITVPINGDGYINSSIINLVIQIIRLGTIICGLIGTVLYNTLLSNKGKIYGYKWYHYFLSVLTSIIGLNIGYLLFTK